MIILRFQNIIGARRTTIFLEKSSTFSSIDLKNTTQNIIGGLRNIGANYYCLILVIKEKQLI